MTQKRNKSYYKKNFKHNFVKKKNIGLMNLGKKKSIDRFFNETKFFYEFQKKVKINKLYKFK